MGSKAPPIITLLRNAGNVGPLTDRALSKSSAVTRERSRHPDVSILLGVGQACGLRTRPLPFRRAVARRELDLDGALADGVGQVHLDSIVGCASSICQGIIGRAIGGSFDKLRMPPRAPFDMPLGTPLDRLGGHLGGRLWVLAPAQIQSFHHADQGNLTSQ